MTLHDLITLIILPIGTSRYKEIHYINIQVDTFQSYKYFNTNAIINQQKLRRHSYEFCANPHESPREMYIMR